MVGAAGGCVHCLLYCGFPYLSAWEHWALSAISSLLPSSWPWDPASQYFPTPFHIITHVDLFVWTSLHRAKAPGSGAGLPGLRASALGYQRGRPSSHLVGLYWLRVPSGCWVFLKPQSLTALLSDPPTGVCSLSPAPLY